MSTTVFVCVYVCEVMFDIVTSKHVLIFIYAFNTTETKQAHYSTDIPAFLLLIQEGHCT